ncbi:MAG: hypothetical protein SFW35_01240 [Chitinophagales bacterium]|nr:hypothetical protein [Chitinophagales bacterium]
MKKKVLFIVGSMNQTTQMHQISTYLPDFDCYFSQFYGEHPVVRAVINSGIVDNTILGRGQFKKNSDAYLEKHGLKNDYRAKVYGNKYDLVVTCNDMIVPLMFRRTKNIFVQEGMIDRMDTLGKIIRTLKLPRYLAFGTQLNGASNICQVYCVASPGYKDYLAKQGTSRDKIVVTGIPNFDNAESFLNNDFPYRDYVMVATSDIREVFGKEDRVAFIKECVQKAAGRRLLFKLHPNELYERAEKEIKENAPEDTLIFQQGSTNEMIANCQELITQNSTVVYIGMALGKKVSSYFDINELKRLQPIQNGGRSAENIATICRAYVDFKGTGKEFLKQYDDQKLLAPWKYSL